MLAVLLACSSAAMALSRENVEQIKRVTALVEIDMGKQGRGFGTAFCIDAKGIFVTNAHVVHGHKGKFNVILSPGETDQRITHARVLKSDEDMDLALIQIENPPALKPLALGDIKTLFDTMDLTAFGYPFGAALAASKTDYPSISVSTGHVTSLRKKAGELDIIQLDAVLNPGNSGGPVIDGDGKVIGIVQAGLPGAGINFAIPVSRLQKFLAGGFGKLPPEEDPPAGSPADSDIDPFNGHEWELTPYLKGTAPRIRESLNGESERLIVKINEADHAMRQGKLDSENDEKAALDKTRKSPVYVQTAANRTKAEADLETARKSGTPEERLEASSRFNKLRMAIDKMEHDAVANSQELSQDRHNVFNAEKDQKRYTESLTKALAWRAELLDATRNGFMLKGPLTEGSKGTLPRITIEKIIDSTHMMVGFDLITFDMSRPGKDKEGIKVFPASKERIHVLVSQLPTAGMKIGDKLSLDRVFIVEGTKHDESDGTVYLVRPLPSDADKLFEMIVPLRGKIPDSLKKSA